MTKNRIILLLSFPFIFVASVACQIGESVVDLTQRWQLFGK